MNSHLFDPEVLDRLEGLNERYRSLSMRIEELHDEAAHYDLELDRERLRNLEVSRQRVRKEAEALLREVLERLTGE